MVLTPNLLGIHLTLMIGPDPIAVPAPPTITEALSSVEVTHDDKDRSGFQLTFTVGRAGPLELVDYPLVANPAVGVNSRVVILVTFGVVPQVLMDGIVTHRELLPGDEPGGGRLVLTGEDVSLRMDQDEVAVEHPAQDETVIANKIVATYAAYGMVPLVTPPLFIDPPLPIDRTPVQRCTDLQYLKHMAARHGYTFYVDPGPAPFVNTAYFGPPVRADLPQKTLSVNMANESNVSDIRFRHDARAAQHVDGQVLDRVTGQTVPVRTVASTRLPLGLVPDYLTQFGKVRTRPLQSSGLNMAQAYGRAQAVLDASVDETFAASGTLDALRYGGILRARAQVDVRGAGFTNDGTYRVKRVTHRIGQGSYAQDFQLRRAEAGAKLPVVRTV